jgi:hypothetical protein
VREVIALNGDCLAWERLGDDDQCDELVQVVEGANESTHDVTGQVDIIRPSDTVEEIQIAWVDQDDFPYIANAAVDGTFAAPNGFSRTDIESLNWEDPATETVTELGLERLRFTLTWQVDSDSGNMEAPHPVVLLRTAETEPKYAVLVDGIEVDAHVDPEETRVSGSDPLYHAVDGVYMGYGGSLNAHIIRTEARHPNKWSKALYDGFGLPIDWVPPTNPELIGGTADAVMFYVGSARSAAEEATAAVRSAIENVKVLPVNG